MGNALHEAARSNQQEATRLLLEVAQATGNVDAHDSSGVTPLIASAQAGATAALRTLCEGGANLDAPSANGATAACAACEGGHLAAVEVLCEFMASMTEGKPRPPMEIAVVAARYDMIDVLMASGSLEGVVLYLRLRMYLCYRFCFSNDQTNSNNIR